MAWYKKNIAEIKEELDVNLETGLSSLEVEKRRIRLQKRNKSP